MTTTLPSTIDGDGILLRTVPLEVSDMDERKGVIDVQAVPYDVEAELIPGVRESFAPGTFARQVGAPSSWARVKMLLGHADGQVPLGRAIGLTEVRAGLRGQFQLNMRLIRETERGREAWIALEDGDLDEVSVGFQSVRRGGTELRSLPNGDRLLRRVKAHLSHLALVPVGAYGRDARVLSYRDALDSGVMTVEEVRAMETDQWADWRSKINGWRGTV